MTQLEALVDAAVRDAETGDREMDPSVLLLWARLYAEREARAALSTARPAARFWPSYQVYQTVWMFPEYEQLKYMKILLQMI